MFHQGKRPALSLRIDDLYRLAAALHAAGYTQHRGLRITRQGEVMAWKKLFLGDSLDERQVHVQAVLSLDGDLRVFAHTESAGYGWKHLKSAVLDHGNFGAGKKMLLKDLRGRL